MSQQFPEVAESRKQMFTIMHKCLDASAAVMGHCLDAAVQANEANTLPPVVDGAFIRVHLETSGLYLSSDNLDKLASLMGDDILQWGPTSCCVHEWAHLMHHAVLEDGESQTMN